MRCFFALILYLTVIFSLKSQTKSSENFISYIGIYQKFLSPIIGGNCPMYPSCSNFGLQAFTTFQPFTAFALTTDRLMRCNHDLKFYKKITWNDERFRFDSCQFLTTDNRLIKNQLFAYSDTTANPDLSFIKYLINEGLFINAITEIEKLIYYKKEINNRELYVNYLICLQNINKTNKAILEYEYFQPILKNDPVILSQIGELNSSISNYNIAISFYKKSNYFASDTFLINKNLLHIANEYCKLNQLDSAILNLNSITHTNFYYDKAMFNKQLIENQRNKKYKKLYVAGMLSVLPGVGYVYSKHYQTAFTSLLINSLMFYATYSSIKSKNYGMSALVGIFGFSFYIGNIFGSIKSVSRYNINLNNELVDKLKY